MPIIVAAVLSMLAALTLSAPRLLHGTPENRMSELTQCLATTPFPRTYVYVKGP